VSEQLTYETCAQMPIGTVVADAEGYWANHHRHYVKTADATWAVFFHRPSEAEIGSAVAERRNNLSPSPHWLANVFYPELFPGTRDALASLTIHTGGAGRG
jgi:hypothetical protein